MIEESEWLAEAEQTAGEIDRMIRNLNVEDGSVYQYMVAVLLQLLKRAEDIVLDDVRENTWEED